jgi:hypothetical protein
MHSRNQDLLNEMKSLNQKSRNDRHQIMTAQINDLISRVLNF